MATTRSVGHALACHGQRNGERTWMLGGLSITRGFAFHMAEYRRRLPHFHPDGEYLFVTWRLHGSLPVAQPEAIYATPGQSFAAQDRALAQSHGTLWLSDTRIARQVVEVIRSGQSQKRFYEVHAWVVMPKHVHLLILPQVSLPQITHWIKVENSPGVESVAGASGRTLLAA